MPSWSCKRCLHLQKADSVMWEKEVASIHLAFIKESASSWLRCRSSILSLWLPASEYAVNRWHFMSDVLVWSSLPQGHPSRATLSGALSHFFGSSVQINPAIIAYQSALRGRSCHEVNQHSKAGLEQRHYSSIIYWICNSMLFKQNIIFPKDRWDSCLLVIHLKVWSDICYCHQTLISNSVGELLSEV